jgi:signal peptidase I
MISSGATLMMAMRVGLTCAIACAMVAQPYRPMVVVGRSMQPTYGNHSVVLTQPIRQGEIKQGAVVVIDMPTGPIVKRIAFGPGDKFMQVCFDGIWTDLIFARPTSKKCLARANWREFTIPQGMVYVLGDNQQVSYDSKQFGCVPVAWIKRILVDQRPFDIFSNHQRPPSNRI